MLNEYRIKSEIKRKWEEENWTGGPTESTFKKCLKEKIGWNEIFKKKEK